MIFNAASETTSRSQRIRSLPRAGVQARARWAMSQDEERRLARRWRQHGDRDALSRLVAAHQGLVVKIALEFRRAGPAFEDLLQEGQVGLTIAARRFDPGRRVRLSTYATYWIRACMMDHVVRSHGAVRIGTTRAQRKIFFGLGRARRRLEALGLEADAGALALELRVPEIDVRSMIGRLTRGDVSLDGRTPLDDRRLVEERLMQLAGDPESSCADQEEGRTRLACVQRALQELDPREQEILQSRHLCDQPETLAEVGERFGLSRERVRQLESRAKARIRQLCGQGGRAFRRPVRSTSA